jgi:hypothetical protein
MVRTSSIALRGSLCGGGVIEPPFGRLEADISHRAIHSKLVLVGHSVKPIKQWNFGNCYHRHVDACRSSSVKARGGNHGAASKRDRYSNDFAGALDNSKPEVVTALIAKAANSVSSEVAA